MLVIVSDLHLSDGSTGATLDPGACDLLIDRLRDLAWRASWRGDGGYRPIERIDLVLLGDVLDLMRSHRWLRTEVRPWDAPNSPGLLETFSGILDDILRHNAPALARLRGLATDGLVTVPYPTPAGQPVHAPEQLPVPVRTHYMIGNTDWPLHLRGPQFDLLRHRAAHHLGLSTPHQQPFPHEPAESDELLDALRRHRVVARHGEIFDPLSFSEDRDLASLSDAILIELFGRFQFEALQQLGGDLPAAAAAALAEIDHVRPLLLAPVWLEGMLERTVPQPAVRKAVKRVWDAAADGLLALDIVRQRDHWSPLDLLDGLASALKFSRRESTGWASKTTAWLQRLRGAENDSFARHALAEPDFRNRRARHIVYGHTHAPETVPLEASFADGFVLSQTYFNAGTWRRVYRPVLSAAGGHEFIPADTLTYLAFFQGDERSGRSFETWSGTLAVNPATSLAPPAAAAPAAAARMEQPLVASPQLAAAGVGAQFSSTHFAAAQSRTAALWRG